MNYKRELEKHIEAILWRVHLKEHSLTKPKRLLLTSM